MSINPRMRALLALIAALVLAFTVAACGDDDDDDDGGETTAGLIEENPDNNGVQITVGSKNFTEQIVLGEIYAQALEAAGYDVSTDLNLGDETVALEALESGEVDGYPEYTATALTSFFEFAPEDVPADPQQAFEESQDDFENLGLVAYPPTPFSSANAVGLLAKTAEELDVSTISDLEGKSQDLTLYGSPECRQRIDCLVGLEQNYGLEFKDFTPVDIGCATRYSTRATRTCRSCSPPTRSCSPTPRRTRSWRTIRACCRPGTCSSSPARRPPTRPARTSARPSRQCRRTSLSR
jgi:osmoprotectant transport system substrate-binding protein